MRFNPSFPESIEHEPASTQNRRNLLIVVSMVVLLPLFYIGLFGNQILLIPRNIYFALSAIAFLLAIILSTLIFRRLKLTWKDGFSVFGLWVGACLVTHVLVCLSLPYVLHSALSIVQATAVTEELTISSKKSRPRRLFCQNEIRFVAYQHQFTGATMCVRSSEFDRLQNRHEIQLKGTRTIFGFSPDDSGILVILSQS